MQPGFEDENTDKTPIIRYCAVSGIEHSHKTAISDLQWIPDHIEVNNKPHLQIIPLFLKWHMLTSIQGYWNQTKFQKHKVWRLREAAQIGQTFIPLCEKVVETQHGRIPIDPAILAVIEYRFIAKNNK